MARDWKVGWAGWALNLNRLCLVVLVLFGFCAPAPGADLLDRVQNQEVSQILRLKVGRSKVLRTPFALTRVSIADPDIADLILISEREIYFNALAPGGIFGVNRINSLASVPDLSRVFTGVTRSSSTTTFTQTLSPAIMAMGGWTAAGTLWSVFMDLLKQPNLGRVLAEPNLVTTSGQQASFLAGGYVVPGLRVREMNTHVEVNDGQTFAIAGPLSDTSNRTRRITKGTEACILTS